MSRLGARENLTVTLSAFKRSLASKEPPLGLSPALAALWWAGKDEWNKAHEIVMNRDDPDCTWVHAYLHRVEGDLGNARCQLQSGFPCSCLLLHPVSHKSE